MQKNWGRMHQNTCMSFPSVELNYLINWKYEFISNKVLLFLIEIMYATSHGITKYLKATIRSETIFDDWNPF